MATSSDENCGKAYTAFTIVPEALVQLKLAGAVADAMAGSAAGVIEMRTLGSLDVVGAEAARSAAALHRISDA
jgi:hypothetical protein